MDTEAFVVFATFALGGAFVLSWTPWGRALADRLRRPQGNSEELSSIRADFEDRLDRMHQEVGELAERLDFTERLLASARQSGQLPPVEDSSRTPL